MPRIKTNALTASHLRKLTAPGTFTDGQGLELRIDAKGNRKWVQRVTIGGKRHNLGLGRYPSTTLSAARAAAASNQQAIAEGRDILTEKREAKAPPAPVPTVPTFEEVARTVIALRSPTWSNPKHAAQWTSTLETYAFPTLGDKAIDEITASDVLATLEPIWTCKPETGSRIRQRIETVIDYAVSHNWRLDNPAGRALLKVLPNTKKLKSHHAALAYGDVPAALRKVGLCTAYPSTKLAFHLMVLTATRSGEIRGATWSEIDWESATWTVPAERMKARRSHEVPLSTSAVEILKQAWDLTGGEGLIFPAPRSGKLLTDMTLTQLLRRLEIPATVHGFRSSFRDWAAEKSGANWAVCESALAHNVGNSTEQAYMRSTLFEQRRELMQEWSNYITG